MTGAHPYRDPPTFGTEWAIEYQMYPIDDVVSIWRAGCFFVRAKSMSEACALFHDRFDPIKFAIKKVRAV